MPEQRLRGLPGAPGIAVGTTWREPVAVAAAGAARSLDEAVEVATAELAELVATSEDESADILTFQMALLEDDELLAPARAALLDGADTLTALATAFDPMVAEYRGSDDPTFAARAADLADLHARLRRAAMGAVSVADAPMDAVVLADDLPPSRFVELSRSGIAGIALAEGGAASHLAILAKGRGTPLVLGLGATLHGIATGLPTILDGTAGTLVADADPASLAEARARAEATRSRAHAAAMGPAVTRSGRGIAVRINADDPAALARTDVATTDGIGLVRTEFLFGDGPPSEDRQLDAYRAILAWAAGRKVTFRTLDAGGDKPVPGLTRSGETNPFLGLRGLRLCLAEPSVFRTQLRALARAAVAGPCEVMLPMVTRPDEIAAARTHLEAVLAELAASGTPHARFDLGMMIEVPAAALRPEAFDVAFYSIGSNDLIQYVTASSRDDAAVAPLADPRDPTVHELIGRVVATGKRLGRPVSLCGDMASDPSLVPLLLDLGLDSLSVAPAALGPVKEAIRAHL